MHNNDLGARNKVIFGTKVTGNIATGAYKDVSITFSTPFTNIPQVVANAYGADAGSVILTSLTKNGFTARVTNTIAIVPNTYSFEVHWIAVGI